jgi:hypothetical protein
MISAANDGTTRTLGELLLRLPLTMADDGWTVARSRRRATSGMGMGSTRKMGKVGSGLSTTVMGHGGDRGSDGSVAAGLMCQVQLWIGEISLRELSGG